MCICPHSARRGPDLLELRESNVWSAVAKLLWFYEGTFHVCLLELNEISDRRN